MKFFFPQQDLGLELGALYLLGRCSNTWAMPPALSNEILITNFISTIPQSTNLVFVYFLKCFPHFLKNMYLCSKQLPYSFCAMLQSLSDKDNGHGQCSHTWAGVSAAHSMQRLL
jgi:hypothetical protein